MCLGTLYGQSHGLWIYLTRQQTKSTGRQQDASEPIPKYANYFLSHFLPASPTAFHMQISWASSRRHTEHTRTSLLHNYFALYHVYPKFMILHGAFFFYSSKYIAITAHVMSDKYICAGRCPDGQIIGLLPLWCSRPT